jgi:hypothetical protein
MAEALLAGPALAAFLLGGQLNNRFLDFFKCPTGKQSNSLSSVVFVQGASRVSDGPPDRELASLL